MSGAVVSSRRMLLCSLLREPKMCVCIFGAGAAHVGLCAAGLGGWPCPFLQATGWPCPGCGLGRACVLIFRGDWIAAVRLHAFAPLLLVTLALLGAGLLLRASAHATLLAGVQWVEERTPLVPTALGALLFYWALRFALDASAFRALVN